MQIAIIGLGNIGRAVATGLATHDHQLTVGLRDVNNADAKKWVTDFKNIKMATVAEAMLLSEVIIVAVPLAAVPELAESMGNVEGKLIIETTNAFGKPLPGYGNATTAIKTITGNNDVVKCFNTIGAENLSHPLFGNLVADMFVAGNSKKAKDTAIQLSDDLGFGNCFDLGGDEALPLLESIAQLWGTLAFSTKLGRRLAFKALY